MRYLLYFNYTVYNIYYIHIYYYLPAYVLTLFYSQVCSLDDYISRCPPEQKHIYYLIAPSREAALQSPYYETFRKHKKEVLFLYNTIDDFVMSNVKEFGGEFVGGGIYCSSGWTSIVLL